MTKAEFVALSDFRSQIARFQRFSVAASRAGGLTQTQYLLLLHVAGHPEREWATVGELAERLQASPHGTAALVQRCVALRLVEKRRSAEDARRIHEQTGTAGLEVQGMGKLRVLLEHEVGREGREELAAADVGL